MIGRALLFWVGLAAIGVLNGTLRQLGYGPFLSPEAAHVTSSVTALILIFAAVYGFVRWQGEALSSRGALGVGVMWVTLTILFEFGFGHWVVGHPWSRLLADYDLSSGRVWALVLLGIGIAPWFWVRRRGTPGPWAPVGPPPDSVVEPDRPDPGTRPDRPRDPGTRTLPERQETR